MYPFVLSVGTGLVIFFLFSKGPPVTPLYSRLTTTSCPFSGIFNDPYHSGKVGSTWCPGAPGTNLGGSEASTIKSDIGSLQSS
ncbi:hypothetical protein BJ165DRAFT_1517866 [Panaeolus papilionaceus]|nr:hypothetical protein BJ165DRAFT_1517866 [Panaeolus papilionaceus]